MSALTPWMQELVARISGTTEEIVQRQLIYVVRDFCRESLAWRDLLQGYSVSAGCSVVDVNPVDGRRECLQVLNVYLDGRELEPASASRPYAGDLSDGTPMAYTCEQGPSLITLLPTPSTDSICSLAAYVALCPKCPEIWMPPLFQQLHYEAILDGTLGRFFSQPNRPYTSERAAAYHLQRYRHKTREAWAHAQRGNTVNAVNWSFPSFGV